MKQNKISISDFKNNPTLNKHSERSKAVARALDNKDEKLPYSKVFTAEQFKDFLTQLTPKRFELLQLATLDNQSISDLASASKRDPSAVSKDILRLSEMGLVEVSSVPNQGHGRKKIVSTVANNISIIAHIGINH